MSKRHNNNNNNVGDTSPERQRSTVSIPEKGSFVTEIRSTLKETFFPDNPIRTLQKQTPRERFFTTIAYVFPVFNWAQGYTLLNLKDDVIAGLTIGSLCIPQDIGYAKLAGLPPIYGLCKSQNTLTCLLTICTTQTYSDICLYT